MFLIKAASYDKACSQGKSPIGEANGKIFLNQQTVKGKFADEGEVLHRKANDD